VIILNAALEDDDTTQDIVLRGTVHQDTLKFIRIDWYQREQGFSQRHIAEIISGFTVGGKIPDITLGMRGQRVTTVGNAYHLKDPVFCINGGQRLYAAALAQMERPSLRLSIGAKIHFGTDETIENAMFCKYGTTEVRISPSLMLRNKKKESAAANVLVSLNQDENFALKERIAWDQTKSRGQLLNGYTLARITGALHGHKGGSLRSHRINELAGSLDTLVDAIGEDTLRINLIRFFNAIDKCWNIRNLSGGRDETRPQLRPEFLLAIATLTSRYTEFWDGAERNEFHFPERYIKRLKGFKLADYMRAGTRYPPDFLFETLRKRLNLDPVFAEEDARTAAQ